MTLAISVSVIPTRGGKLRTLVARRCGAVCNHVFSPLPSADARGARSKHLAHKADAVSRRSARAPRKSALRGARLTCVRAAERRQLVTGLALHLGTPEDRARFVG